MQERHSDRSLYFQEQNTTFSKYILPFINQEKEVNEKTRVLEIGCGYGGNLVPFLDLGCDVTGIDISEHSIEVANRELEDYKGDKLTLIASDVYLIEGLEDKFDLIFMKDTLEHIPNQEKLLKKLMTFLKDDGVMFQGFPPWCNPFGGHQQMCKSKILSKLPWFHLYPRPLFKLTLKIFGETPGKIDGLLTGVYDTRISIHRFEKICKRLDIKKMRRNLYFINPNYEIKFGLKPKLIWPFLNIPILREFWTTTAYYIVKK